MVLAALSLWPADTFAADKTDRRGRPPDMVTPTQRPTPVPVAPPAVPTPDDPYADPSRDLGAVSPSCRYALEAKERRACKASGSALQPHPLSSYGLDVRSGFSVTDPSKSFMSALQSIGAALWMALLYLVKGVLLLLEWTFSLDLTNEAMPQARQSLARLHNDAFGESWLLLAISLTGLWGMWRGLVQGRTVETFGGLAATVALIVLALVIISLPAETVGRAAKISNDGGMAVLAAGTGGNVDEPRQALTKALAHVFDTTVRGPWCALEFGSVTYCGKRLPDRERPNNAELWLKYPAQGWERGQLHELMKGEKKGGFSLTDTAKDVITGGPAPGVGAGASILGTGADILGIGGDDKKLPDDVAKLVDKAPAQARMQEAGGTFPRLALLVVVAIGVLGAVALYAWLGLRLLLASGLGLVLLLMAPAMLIAPALGERGRATFIAWGQRLIGAILAKLVFAIFLTVVLVASGVFESINLGWFGTWLLQAGFWWGIFLKRHDIIEFASAGTPQETHSGAGHVVSQAYYGWMLGRGLRQTASRALDPARSGLRTVQRSRDEGRLARTSATRELAGEQLDEQGRTALAAEEGTARQAVGKREEVDQELRAVDRQLHGYDERAASARASGTRPTKPTDEERNLAAHRQQLRRLSTDPSAREAEQAVRHADRNRAITGEGANDRDLEVYRARRSRELAAELPLDDDRHLRAAGIEPSRYAAASSDEQADLRDRVATHLQKERTLHAATEPNAAHRAEALPLDGTAVRARTAEHRARLRAERRRERIERGVYRR